MNKVNREEHAVPIREIWYALCEMFLGTIGITANDDKRNTYRK